MCGIVGYLGQEIQANWLVGVLKKLEYRGYDSSGVAGFNEFGLKIIKKTGQIKNLEEALPKTWEIELGLLHTRWATHGKCIRAVILRSSPMMIPPSTGARISARTLRTTGSFNHFIMFSIVLLLRPYLARQTPIKTTMMSHAAHTRTEVTFPSLMIPWK